MRWQGGRRYGGIEDRRGTGGRYTTGGGVGIGVMALSLAGYFLFGINPLTFIETAGVLAPESQEQGRQGTPQDQAGQFLDAMLSSTTDIWRAAFETMGRTYAPPQSLVLFERATGTACGTGQSVMGPFYCPGDQRIYLDLEFFRELQTRFAAPGDFAQAYVIAHEVGHHVQHVLGTDAMVRRAQAAAGCQAEANRYSVALELQADCFAGVWAANASRVSGGQIALEAGDLEEGLRAAEAIGDDTLQRQAQGRVVPDSFTHGSSAERMAWLGRGYEQRDPAACDTFAGL